MPAPKKYDQEPTGSPGDRQRHRSAKPAHPGERADREGATEVAAQRISPAATGPNAATSASQASAASVTGASAAGGGSGRASSG
jgi:hypothetical protein